MFEGNASTYSASAASNSTDTQTQRLSRVELSDKGPVRKEARSVKSNDSLASEGVAPPFLTVFGDLQRSRDSMISLTEMEHGWSSHPSGLNTKNRGPFHRSRSSEGDAVPTHAREKPAYRPAFAPTVSDADLDGLVPSLSQSAPNTPNKPLTRGRSLREKLQGVISGNRPPVPQSTGVIHERDEDADLDDKDDKKGHVTVGSAPTSPIRGVASSSAANTSFGAGIARRLSRKTTTKVRQNDDPGYTLPSQAELDKIPLYAAPPEAKVANAPMLSSYAPRPALRPRAMTTDGNLGGANLKPQPSITVGQARLAYAKSLSRPRHAPPIPASQSGTSVASNASTINNIPHRRSRVSSQDSNQEEALSMQSTSRRSGRRSRHIPEGWAVADAHLQEVSSSEERDSPRNRAAPLPGQSVVV